MKIALATIFYNNCAELQRLVDSIPPKVVDNWIAVDGPFRYNLDINPDLSHKSNDGSIKVIFDSAPKFNGSIILHHKPGATEFDKRNTYLENCSKLGDIDVIIIVDSDEYFIYPPGITPLQAWQRFRKDMEILLIQNRHHNVYGIQYEQADSPSDTYKPRIWVNPAKMRYLNGSHYHYANVESEQKDIELFKKNRLNYVQQALSIIKGGIILTHDQSLRTKEYQEQRKQYQQYLVRYEELVQSYNHDYEEADKLAKQDPSTTFDPPT